MYDYLYYFRKILAETPVITYQYVHAVENASIAAGFKALANFTYKVTMPYLNFVEISSQAEFIKVLPQLFKDLSAHNLKTMQEYTVSWTHVTSTTSPLSELDCYLLDQMCFKATKGVRLQCSIEYWDDTRTTQLHKLQPDQLNNLPTNNLVSERYLAMFGTCLPYLPNVPTDSLKQRG